MELRLDARGLTEGGRLLSAANDAPSLLGALRDALSRAPRPVPNLPDMPFQGGLVGAAGYDVARRIERLPNSAVPLDGQPDGLFMATQSILVFDHVSRRVAVLHDGPETERRELAREIRAALRGAVPAARPVRFGEATPSIAKADFIDGVSRTKEYIAAGDVYQLVLSIRFGGPCDLEPFQVYRALRLLNPSPYMYYCDFGECQVVGSSPEALVRMHGRRATLRPIAGTRPRGRTPAIDLANERELLADPKEAAEHVMLVDLARNDLGRVAIPGSVKVDPYRIIERYSHVMHIVSGVDGVVAPEYDPFDLFAATFPAGTVVGAPKVRAMEIIDELEPVRRGLYAGTVGYFGHGGHMDQAIAIRTLFFRDGAYAYQAGAGIVADSVPEMEHRECHAKGAALGAALQLAREGL